MKSSRWVKIGVAGFVAWTVLLRVMRKERALEQRSVDVNQIAGVPFVVESSRIAFEWRHRLAHATKASVTGVRFQPSGRPIFVMQSTSSRDGTLPVAVPLSAFFEADFDGHLFARSPVEEWHQDASWRELAVDEVDADAATAIVLLSSTGVVSRAHYDVYHNFLAQLRGVETIELWEPGEIGEYFSKLSGAGRQSRLNKLPSAPRLNVTLTPGSVLYIPPYWVYSMKTLTSSLSLNVVSPALEDAAVQTAFALGAPLGACDVSDRPVGAQIFLAHLLARLVPNQAPSSIASRLLATRYPNHATHHDLCFASDPRRHEAIRAQCPGNPVAVVRAAKTIAATVRSLGSSVLDIFVFDYIEQLAAWAVGLDQAPTFIRSCLNLPPLDTTPFDSQPPADIVLNAVRFFDEL